MSGHMIFYTIHITQILVWAPFRMWCDPVSQCLSRFFDIKLMPFLMLKSFSLITDGLDPNFSINLLV